MLWLLGALGLTGGGIGVAALLGGGPWMLLAARSALAFLGRLNIWQLLLIAALLIAGVQTLRLKMEQRTDAKLTAQIAKLSDQLNRISTAKNTQATVTKTNIVTVTKTIHDAEGKARKVETAPLPGNCKTPDAVRQADL